MSKVTPHDSKEFCVKVEDKPMKILHVNCVYGQGSTGKIVQDIHYALQQKDIDSIVCYGRGDKAQEPNVYKVCYELLSKANNAFSRISGFVYGGCFLSTNKLIRIIKREHPDVVHLHCINGYFVNIYRLITWLKKNNVNTVLTLHAEFPYTANCGLAFDCEKWKTGCGKCPRLLEETGSLLFDRTHQSWKKMQKAFLGSENHMRITSVSAWLGNRAKLSPFLKNHQQTIILNGVDTTIFKPRADSDEFQQYKEGNKKLILHVTARFSDPNKGGHLLLQLAERLGDEYRILLVGSELPKQQNVPANVVCIGEVRDQARLAALYSLADVTVLTSKAETFSLICAESLCCGTPVCGFYAGGPEQISLPEYSDFCEFGDLCKLEESVKKWANRPKENACGQLAHEKYSKQRMVDEYINLYYTL